MEPLRFFVQGTPAPKGSGRAVAKGVYLPGSSKVGQRRIKAFTLSVQWAARQAMRGREMFPPLTPILLRLVFRLERPASHFTKAGKLNASAPDYPTKKPDLSKLIRCCEDGLSGIAYDDDARVVWTESGKLWAGEQGPGVWIGVGRMETPHAEMAREVGGEPEDQAP